MTTDKNLYNETLKRRIELIQKSLGTKNKEYAHKEHPYRNFIMGAAHIRSTPHKVLWGYMLKHFISVEDIIEGRNQKPVTEDYVEEKIGDMINYLILLEGILKKAIRERGEDIAPNQLKLNL